jgi:hypothetical protein
MFSIKRRVIRANNSGVNCLNANDCYTSLSATHTTASAGDTIHIEPTGTNYGNVTFSKAIVVLGNGYFLGNAAANSNDGLQINTASSAIGNITLQTDAEEYMRVAYGKMNALLLQAVKALKEQNQQLQAAVKALMEKHK